MKITLQQLAKKINAKIKGDPECEINGIATLQSAKSNELSFLDNPQYKKYLSDTKAAAVILTEEDVDDCPVNALIVNEPYFAYSVLAKEFVKNVEYSAGIHPSAIIGNACHIHPTVAIAANVVIGDRVTIGENTVIAEGCVLEEDCIIGKDCFLWPKVSVYYDVQIGDRVVIHSGTVLGSDGFGFAQHEGRWHKLPQLGTVIIEEDVQIGANTTIDRGALDNTVIHAGVKLGDQIQIAHNVHIGENTIVVGCVGIAGSTHIGKNCQIGGAAGIGGHLTITDNVLIGAMAMITKSISEPGAYSSGTGFMKNHDWQKNVVRFRQLDKLLRRLQKLEEKIVKE